MKNNNDPIRQENKRALPRFILIVALSLVLGGMLGFALVSLGLEEFDAALAAAGLFFTNHIAPWLIIACGGAGPVPAHLFQREKAAFRLGRGGRDGQRPGGGQAVGVHLDHRAVHRAGVLFAGGHVRRVRG